MGSFSNLESDQPQPEEIISPVVQSEVAVDSEPSVAPPVSVRSESHPGIQTLLPELSSKYHAIPLHSPHTDLGLENLYIGISGLVSLANNHTIQ